MDSEKLMTTYRTAVVELEHVAEHSSRAAKHAREALTLLELEIEDGHCCSTEQG
jgi:hypothetical protein